MNYVVLFQIELEVNGEVVGLHMKVDESGRGFFSKKRHSKEVIPDSESCVLSTSVCVVTPHTTLNTLTPHAHTPYTHIHHTLTLTYTTHT